MMTLESKFETPRWRAKARGLRFLLLPFVFVVLSGCAGTSNYVARPEVTVLGSGLSLSDSVEVLFADESRPYTIVFCEADESIGECIEAEGGPSAKGLGGIFLPIEMDLKSIYIQELDTGENGFSFVSKLSAPVNSIEPSCGEVNGRIIVEGEEAARIELTGFYCNWAVIGNVVTNIKFSIDRIDLDSRSFSGYYSLAFRGTGNATGSGYFKASIQ